MALPKINSPTFELKLPSTGQSVKYRPFLVKEEKILLVAQQSGELKDILNAVVQIANNCIYDDIEVEKLPLLEHYKSRGVDENQVKNDLLFLDEWLNDKRKRNMEKVNTLPTHYEYLKENIYNGEE